VGGRESTGIVKGSVGREEKKKEKEGGR